MNIISAASQHSHHIFAHRLCFATHRSGERMKRLRLLGQATFFASITACTVGPDYVPASAPVPEKFKELKGKTLKGWKLATLTTVLMRSMVAGLQGFHIRSSSDRLKFPIKPCCRRRQL